ncbi:hypothetical protein VB713_09125 [Anabaena cylindrica UHCC 0172]|uniref:hypothetical protein n=1 Tax=Anabaena cylindrica TaxID=1165 RepID=UPI002B215663|nr:hypothetical protein [Anabaena cylindrica]MEA5551133.1 hypothetical protein [Anabaena cylindrica UHCC 0172]
MSFVIIREVARCENPDVVNYLVERAKLFGLVKATRKRHRDVQQITQKVWEAVPLVDTNEQC